MEEILVAKYEDDSYLIKVIVDPNPDSPAEWNRDEKVVCFHPRFMGDNHEFGNKYEFIESLLSKLLTYDKEADKGFWDSAMVRLFEYWMGSGGMSLEKVETDILLDMAFNTTWEKKVEYGKMLFNSEEFKDLWDQMVEDSDFNDLYDLVENSNKIVIAPVYAYEHGGMTISLAPFSCPWDSGQIGWAYTFIDDYADCPGEEIEKYMDELVKAYDMYLKGEVFAVITLQKKKCNCCGHTEYNEEDSCYGIYAANKDILMAELKSCASKATEPLIGKLEWV